MSFTPFFILLLVGWLSSFTDRAAAAPQPGKSVTTTWLPDRFPNTPPKALDRSSTTEVNLPMRTPSVLLDVYDVENDPLAVSSFTQPRHGAAVLNPDGTFTYTPQPNFLGEDEFRFTLTDGRGGSSTARMRVRVIPAVKNWSATSFTDLAEVRADGKPIDHGKQTTTFPRAVHWSHPDKKDLLVGALGAVWLYRNVGTSTEPRFARGVKVQAAGRDIQFGTSRLALAFVDMNQDRKKDLLVIPASDRKVRYFRNLSTAEGPPVLAAPSLLKDRTGKDFVVEDPRVEVADWNGDGLPDLVIGTRDRSVKIAYNVGTASAPVFAEPTTVIDAEGRTLGGAYNLNVRVADINQDGVPDLVDSYNWGNINFRVNQGSAVRPRLPETGTFEVTGPAHARLDLHALCDGPIVDFADLDGDGTLDLVLGGERGGKVWLARGESAQVYFKEIQALLAAHPRDLDPFLNDPANAPAKQRLQVLLGALYDYVVNLATPRQKQEISRELVQVITRYPQYFKLQTLDLKRQPGMPSLAVQTWLTLLLVDYYSPEARKSLCDAAGFTGGYRKLVEEIGLIYADNGHNPRGAEAIYQWVRTIPREIYPGTCITANDWLGGRVFLVRGHTKNTFNGYPVDGGEYGFGQDARAVIGDRGSENWFMTVVHHEASHDVDAFVRKNPDLYRRWGQTLVLAGGPDMRADPKTGWLSWDLTREHFRQASLWDGKPASWEAALKKYWTTPPGSGWRDFGFMRGNIGWFYGAPQESLATQGNQFWNSTEGRLAVALDRWKRGYQSNLTEVLFFLDIWSLGLNKVKFYENDNACNQVISFAALRRNRHGYIDRIDLGDRCYEFVVDARGVVTKVVHAPGFPSSSRMGSASPGKEPVQRGMIEIVASQVPSRTLASSSGR